jgi:hypothetical protein
MEIDRAISIDGARIEVVDGYFFEDVAYIFKDFVDNCEVLRTLYKGTPTEQVVKLLQNSLYGKFGTQITGRQLMIADTLPTGREWLPMIDPDTCDVIDNVFVREEDRSANYMMPHWAAWITAGARLSLLDLCYDIGYENTNYTDTDSCQFHGNVDYAKHIGNAYGECKLEYEMEWARYHAPKCYCGETGQKFIGVAKGIVRKYREDKDFLLRAFDGAPLKAKWESPNSMLTYLRTGVLSVTRERSITNWANVTSHRIVDGQYRPVLLGEF